MKVFGKAWAMRIVGAVNEHIHLHAGVQLFGDGICPFLQPAFVAALVRMQNEADKRQIVVHGL